MTRPFPIPVRPFGPGSQPQEEQELQYLDMPQGMNTFSMPRVPERVDPAAMASARDRLAQLLPLLEAWDPASGTPGPRLDLSDLAPDALEVMNQVLGEGEVGIRIMGGRDVRIQESVFTGLWRVHEVAADGAIAIDRIEAGILPPMAIEAARAAASVELPAVEIPEGAMNSPALLAEIGGQMRDRRPGDAPHTINLTLFPMSPADHQTLAQALGAGPVAMISRGFGDCRIASTQARDVWRVQYFNNAKTMILDTVVMVEAPEEAAAAVEDFADTRVRLAELIQWMGEDLA